MDIFSGCSKLTSITVPEGMTKLPDRAFCGCSDLVSISLPSTLKEIGSSAFSGCSRITSIAIPDGVTSIGESAFSECSGLTSIVIPDGVESLSASILYGCTGLTSVTLPSNLKSIGGYAFQRCTNLTTVSIPDSVTSIARGAFYGCSNLQSVNIPLSWTTVAYYNGTGEDIFSGCSKLTNITVPEGVTKLPDRAFSGCDSLIRVTLPDSLISVGNYAFYGCNKISDIYLGISVTSVGNYAFYNCSSLNELIISDNLKSIGQYAFYNCSALAQLATTPRVTNIGTYAFYNTAITEVDVPVGVSTINNYTFANCADLTKITMRRTVASISTSAFNNSPNVVIYCYNGSAAHTFAVNNGIQFVIMEEPAANGSEVDNNYVSFSGTTSGGAAFTTKLYVYEYSTLKKLNDVDISCTNGALFMSLSGYYPVNISSCTLSFGNKTKLAMIPESHGSNISAVHCNGQDALANTIKISSETTSLDIYAYSTLPNSSILKYELMQDGSVLTSSTTGKFSINPSKITFDKALSVRVVLKDGTKCTKIKTNITVTDNIVTFEEDISIGSKIKFDVPDDVPLIGGGEVSFDFTTLPVVFEKDGDTFRIGIGCKRDLLKNENSWVNYKKFIETQDKNIQKGINNLLASKFGPATAGPKGSFDMKVYGYVEGTISDAGNWSRVGGLAFISVTGKVSQEWQTIVIVVPVVVKFSAEAGAEATISVGFNFDNAEVYFDGELTLTVPKLTLSAGIGVAYIADVSVYGSASNKIKFSTKTDSVTATLSGELGVSAKLLFASYKKALLKGSWQYYYSGAANARQMSLMSLDSGSFFDEMQSIDNYTIDRAYVYGQSAWLDVVDDYIDEVESEDMASLQSVELSATNDAPQTLQTSVYYSADPQIVITDSGLKMMVWTADITTRSTGNHTAVVYSIYDESTKQWSEPVIIEDDGTADFYPDVATDGQNIYVIWMDSSRSDFSANSSLTDIAASCDISVAMYSPAEEQFTTASLPSNSGVDFYPVIASVNGNVYATWLGNSQNDILTLAGTNTVYSASYSSGSWSSVQTVATYNKPVAGLTVGNAGGNAALAFTVDTDGDVSTTADMEIYCGAIGSAPKALTSNAAQEQGLQFARIANSPVLAWYEDGNLCYSGNLSSVNTITGPEAGFTPYFSIVDCGGESVLISIVAGEDGSEMYMYNVDVFGIGEPVAISSSGEYISDFTTEYHDSILYTAYTKTSANITSESVYESTDLCVMTVGKFYDLTIEDIAVDQNDVDNGATIPVELTIRNNGTANETQVNVTAKLNNSTKLNTNVTVDLPVGKTATITFNLPLESKIAASSNYVFTVTPRSGSEKYSSDNSKTVVIGYTDLQMSVDKVKSNDTQSAIVTVDNLSCIDTKATLRVRNQDSAGMVLATYYIGVIEAKSSETLNIDVEALPALADEDTTLYFEVIAVEDEEYLTDNYGFIYLMSATPELSVNVSVNGTAYHFDSEVTGACYAFAAVYDSYGKMLGVFSTKRLSSDASVDLSLTVANLPSRYTVKVFLVNSSFAPISEALGKEIK